MSRRQPGRGGRAVVGLMSGTSLDGISAAVARFAPGPDGGVHADLLASVNKPYEDEQRGRIERALTGGTPAEYCRLNFDLGAWLADAARAAVREAGIAPTAVSCIASHGQTIWHEPGHSTWQMGSAAVIAERTGIPVVSDFRSRDVAAGGQGAPLVPIADALLFSHPEEWRLLQNIGGMGNVTVVPPGGDLGAVRAFDTGPGVAVIDGVTRHLFPHLVYDVDGRVAARGTPHEAIVDELLAAPFFVEPPPKSTGRELFTAEYTRSLAARVVEAGGSPEDAVATATLLTARSIALACLKWVPDVPAEMLISGGGARNPTLVGMLEKELESRRVRHFSEIYFDGEAKEAVAFALLGHLYMEGRPGNVSSATGAMGPRVLGSLTPS